MFREPEDKLWQCLAGIIEDEGLRLYDLDVNAPGSLRVFIDVPSSTRALPAEACPSAETAVDINVGEVDSGEASPAKPQVTSGDCSRICRRLMILFAAEGERWGVVPEPHIEVSSPGVNRSLRRSEHFREAVGERIKVTPMDARRIVGLPAGQDVVVGNLANFDGQMLTVKDERTAQDFQLSYQEIRKARVDFVF